MDEHLWDREDLVQRVLGAFELTERAATQRRTVGVGRDSALLIRAAAHLADLDDRVAAALDRLARLVAPSARDEDVRTAMCLEPGRAYEHGFAHVLLTDAGYPDPDFDRLLEQSASVDHQPERRPTRELEQEWLRGIRASVASTSMSNVLRRSVLARPLDALAADAGEHRSFAHAVLYAGDLGRARADLPRSAADIAADADAALASSLDADEHALTAQLLWTWPMLGLPWTPAATFAFSVLVELQDEKALRGSQHTAVVMGMLCAAALVRGRRPERAVPPSPGPCEGAAAIQELLRPQPVCASWQAVYARLGHRQRDSLGDLLVAIALRRARRGTDLALVRETLTLALRHGCVDAPAPRQAVGLLRRTALTGAADGSVRDACVAV